MILDILFHWSPIENRESILQTGLKPYAHPCVHSRNLAYPYICMSPSPSLAWGLSGDMDWVGDIEDWDLWMIRLAEKDDVHVSPNWGAEIAEVRVRNAIPADRLWWVGQRSPWIAKEVKPKRTRKKKA